MSPSGIALCACGHLLGWHRPGRRPGPCALAHCTCQAFDNRPPGGLRNKFGALRTRLPEWPGEVFDSRAEAHRARELRHLELAGLVRDLRAHPVYPLHVGTLVIGRYIADFAYIDAASGHLVVEDVKSVATRTALYRWKARHLRAEYGLAVREILV